MYGIRRALQYTYESMVYNCGKIQSHARKNLFIFWSLKPTNIMGGIKWYINHTLYIFIYIYNQLVGWKMVLCDKTSYSRQTWQTLVLFYIFEK